MVYIDAVKFTTVNSVKVITHLKWTNNLNETATDIATKKQMIDFVKENPNCTKTKIYKDDSWQVGEDVRVVDDAYLRTDANSIKADNLGELPEF